MSIVLTITRWVLGMFFALSFLVYLTTSPLSSIGSLILTVMLIPPLAKFVFTKIPYTFPKKALIAFGIVLFFVVISAVPKTDVKGAQTVATPTPTKAIVPTDTPIATENPTETPTSAPTAKPTPTPTIRIIPTATPTVYIAPTYSAPTQTTNSGYTCDCSKTCTQISSCAEAQYQLNVCGCAQRDGDHDGIACDSAPLHCQN